MKIKFMGAARTVTGSCFIVEAAGHRFAVDCGMHQGNAEIDRRNWEVDLYDPSRIEFFIITHAHIDHSGLIPRMVQKGFHGPVYLTPPTKDLLQVMLLDSAHIQETEAQWKTKRRLRHGDKRIQPLYTQKDAQASFPLLQAVPYEREFEPCDGVRVTLRDAGHILGAALAEIRVRENGAATKLVFSGDLGRPAQLMVRDPSIVEEADVLFMESTYGNRNHKNEDASLDELAEAVAYSHERGEKVIIPAFAVERTQEMIYSLHLLEKSGRLPKGMPVFVDSPLAVAATEIFRRHRQDFDAEAQALLARGEDPLTLPGLRYTQSTQDSIDINAVAGPAVVISASGMADAGRIKHHLRHNLWREGASIVFVGFQAAGTTGRRIIDGAEKVRLFGEDVAVKAKVFTINGFSAHAGQTQLLDWLAHVRNPALRLFLVHGEYAAQQTLAGLVEERFGIRAVIPDYLEETILKPGAALERVEFPEQAAPRIDWAFLLDDMEAKLALLKERRAGIEGRPWVEQTDLRDRLLDINRSLMQLVSES